ncbi:beta strand repeat-containing protein [Dyella choica]|uniref:Filamentous hemagglutinin N-terminal domain-containing protein n=1 Tax=Dyella choica TaxID=1927959 RepID=A0A3S0PJY7_9GAMM|nr:YDG domain-containing protein [Dyella choica]RUL69272.1 filamentous hemagglutinin N-terminal domain-containing protein [Dyella choica]
MNHYFRLVWNRRLGVLQVASELARGRTKGGRSAEGGTRRAAWLAGVPLSLPLMALAATPSPGSNMTTATVVANALPTGGQVTSGAGHLTQQGNTLTITQQSQNLSLNWQSFNIGSQSTVDFVQPNAGAVAVNRIADTNGSQIFGHLNANGQVFLINPNGILFGRDAQVNVGGLVASTLDVNDSALGSGSLSFRGTGKGNVTNLGTINVTGGGYAALLGQQVSNQGAIHAQLGSVALAGGSAVTLNFSGDKLVSVRVDQSTLNALAQNGQLIEANGGNVWMTAGARDSLLASAVNNTGTIEAQTVQNRNGHIVLLGGMDAGTVSVGGTLDSSAPNGGNGGQIETSGAKVNVANDSRITTAAPLGLSGTWLIDPNDFTIAPSGGDITGAALSTELSGGNVVIQSSAGSTSGSGSGNVNVNDAVSWSSHTLTLDAQNNININGTMTASGSAGLALNYGGTNGSSSATPAAGTSVNVGLGGSGFSGQANFTGSSTLSINGNSYTLISSGAALQGMGTSGNYALAGNLSLPGTFFPIGSSTTAFSGVFDGLGHTISYVFITNSFAADVGLFGQSTGTIRNVGLLGGGVSGVINYAAIGDLVGDNSGSISNVFATGSVSGIGGSGVVFEWVGGLVGKNESAGTIRNAFATGPVNGTTHDSKFGGLAGDNYGSILNAYATGAVSELFGNSTMASDDFGGLVGDNWGSIQNAYSTGTVSFAGGGTGNNCIGGLVGMSTGTIANTYATSHLSTSTPSDRLGGLVGYINGGTVTASYWDTTSTGQAIATDYGSSSTAGMTGLTHAQMMQPGQFSWTIATSAGSSDTWRIYSGNTMPLLESLLTPLTISANNQTVTYNGNYQPVSSVVSYSLASPDLSAITLGLKDPLHAGSYVENISSAYSTSYDLSIGTPSATMTVNPATLTATLANSGVTKTYDGTTRAPAGFTPAYSYSGLVSGDTGASLTDTGVAYDSAHVTSATNVTVSGLGISSIAGTNGSLSSDYTLASSNVSGAATITPAPVTVSLSNTSHVTKTYDGTTAAPSGFSPTYSIAGLVAGDSGTASSSATPVFNSAHVASATAITQGGLSLASITGNGSDNSVLGDYTLSSTTAATGGGVASITPATLTPTLTNSGVTKVYDGTVNAPTGFTATYSYSGLVSGDTGASLSNTGAAYNSAHVASAAGITVSGLSISSISGSDGSQASDYTLASSHANGAATITQAPLTVSLSNTTNVSKTYDGTTAAPGGFSPTYSVSGLVSGDSATVSSSATPMFNSAHVASATTITQGGLTLASIIGNGTDNSVISDYALASTTASTGAGVASITPLVLTVTAPTIGGTLTKGYDGTTAASGASLIGGGASGALSGDSLTLDTSGITLSYNSAHVTSASNINASGSFGVNILSSTYGSLSTDYSVGVPSITSVAGTIAPQTLTPTLTNSGVTKVFDGMLSAPRGFTPTYSYTGLVSGDTGANLTDSGMGYNSAHVFDASDITVLGLRISGIVGSHGSLVSDYRLASSSANVAAAITPAPLTVTLTNYGVTKTYDGTTAAPAGFAATYFYSGLISGDYQVTLSGTGVAYNSAHVGSANHVTVSGLSVSSVIGINGSLISDYTVASGSASAAATITPATLTATLTNVGVTKTYDGTTNASGAFTPTYSYGGLVSGDTGASLTDTSAVYDSAHVASATRVTVSGLSINGIAGSNGSLASDYTLASNNANGAATITPAPLTVWLSNSTNVSKAYDGTTATPAGFSPTYSVAGLVSGDSATVSSSATPVFNSAHVASATAILQGGLSLASITGNGTDNSALSDYALSSTSAATGAGVAGISPRLLTATAPTIGGTLTKVYDGTTAAAGASLIGGSVSGALSGDSLSLNATGITLAYNSSHVASASSISASGSLGVNLLSSTNGSLSTDYSAALPPIAAVAGTITAQTLTPTLTNSGVTKVYDGTISAPVGFTPTYSYRGLVSGDTGVNLTDAGVIYNSAHVIGATTITVSGLSISSIVGSQGSQASDYILASTSANVAAAIMPATLTATLTNSGVTKVYDGTTSAPLGFTPTYSYAGLVSGDTSANLASTGAAYNSAQVAGATNVLVSGLSISGIAGSNGSLASDYTLASGSTNVAATITPATLTASLAGPISKVYDGTTVATLTPIDYTLSGFVSGQGATVKQTTGTYNSASVANATTVTTALGSGDYAANSGTILSNYTLPTSASGTASITPALLVVTANNGSKTYDGSAYRGGNGVVYSGFVNGESASALGGALAYSGNSQGAVNAGFYTLTPTGLSSSNYTINYDSGLLTVNPATLTANLIGTVGKVYDGTTTATLASGNYSLNGVIGNDAVSLNDPASGLYATANAGSGINVEVSGLTISGGGAGNYILSNNTATAAIGAITPARLTVTANSASTIYNAQTYSGGNGVTYNGFIDGQTAAVLGGALTYSGSSQGALNVGNYTLMPGGLASNNYAIAYGSGTLTVTPATLTYVATPAHIYAGQVIPTLTGMVTGFQGGDTLANATTGALSFTTPVTTQSRAGQYAISGSGLAANDGNYVFVQAAGNALAFNVVANREVALPGVTYLQQQLGQSAPTGTVLPPGSSLVSTMAASDESSPASVPLRPATSAAAPDLYVPDVRVVGGGVRLP